MTQSIAGGGLYWLAAASAFTFSMAASPGPNNTMLAASGANFGFARTIPHILGISFGFPVMCVLVGVGLGEVLRANPAVYQAMKWVGAGYLLWLAWRIATSRPATGTDNGTTRGRPLRFHEAALFQWVNPKAWMAVTGGIATFTTGRSGIEIDLVLTLAGIFLLITVPSTSCWTALGVGVARVLRHGTALRIFNWCMAALLVGSLLPFLAE